MSSKLYKSIRYAVSLVLAVILLYFSFRGVKWADFAEGLRGCQWWFLAASMCAGLCAFILRGLRWRRLLSPLSDWSGGASEGGCLNGAEDGGASEGGGRVSRFDTCDAVNIGNVSNMVFPYLGEFVRCGIAARNNRLRYDKVIGTVALERVWDMLSLAILFAILFAFRWDAFGAFFTERIWGPIASRLSWGAWAIVGALIVAAFCFLWALVRFHDRNGFLAKAYRGIEGLLQGFGSVMRMRSKGLFILDTALIWCMYWLQIVLLTHAMPEFGALGSCLAIDSACGFSGMTVIDSLFIMLAGSIASFVPVPGGFGAYHYIVALSLSSLYGFPWQAGIIFATLSHESQAITMLLSGGFSFVRQSLRRRAE